MTHTALRWHCHPDPRLRHSGDTIDRHQHAVWGLILDFTSVLGISGDRKSELLFAARRHDEAEKIIGDMPGPAKARFPALAAAYEKIVLMSEETTAIFQPHSQPDLPQDRFLDRELSWLDFNQRVLELAEDRSIPLLERVNFLSIFASNLDEFFMVRVASLKRRVATGIAVQSASGLSPQEVLLRISERTRELQARHSKLFRDEISPSLEQVGNQ